MDSTALNSEAPEAIAMTLSQKVRKRKLWSMVIMLISVLFYMVFLSYLGKTLSLMGIKGWVEHVDSTGNTVDLAGTDLTCSAKDIDTYTFITHTTRIMVKTDDPLDEPVKVTLWSGKEKKDDVLLCYLENGDKTCVFPHLFGNTYYSITVDNNPDIQMTVSQRLTFWEAFVLALQGY